MDPDTLLFSFTNSKNKVKHFTTILFPNSKHIKKKLFVYNFKYMPSRRRGPLLDPSAVDMSLIEESAHKVLMQGIDSDGVATADVINKAFNMRLNKKTKRIEYKKYREVNILMSGGTNSLTAKLAKQSNVDFQGVSIGTFARNLIYKNIKEKYGYEDKGFYTDMKNIKEAYHIAKTLVEANVGEINE